MAVGLEDRRDAHAALAAERADRRDPVARAEAPGLDEADEVAGVVEGVVVVADEVEVEAVDVDEGAAEEAAEDPQMQDSGLGKKTYLYLN